MTVQVFRRLPELAEIAESWDNLVFHIAARPPMLSHAWISAFLEFRHPPQIPWLVLGAFDGGHLIGVFPLEERTVNVLGKTTPTFRTPGDAHTFSIDAVLSPGREREVLTAFREKLDDIARGWFALELSLLDHTSLTVPLAYWLPDSIAVSTPHRYAAAVATTGTWEDYIESRSSKFLHRLRKNTRKLEALGEVRFEFLSGSEAKPEHLSRFVSIEASGWKGRAGSAIGENPELMRFYRAVAERLYERGKLEWHFLRVGERDIAGEFAAKAGRTLFTYKIGYDEAFASYSAGSLLKEQTLARAFADEATDAVNFVTYRDWHEPWRPEKRLYSDVCIYPTTLRSRVAGAWPKQIRQSLRGVPGLTTAVTFVRSWGRRKAA